MRNRKRNEREATKKRKRNERETMTKRERNERETSNSFSLHAISFLVLNEQEKGFKRFQNK